MAKRDASAFNLQPHSCEHHGTSCRRTTRSFHQHGARLLMTAPPHVSARPYPMFDAVGAAGVVQALVSMIAT
jgi:hypothetical protein